MKLLARGLLRKSSKVDRGFLYFYKENGDHVATIHVGEKGMDVLYVPGYNVVTTPISKGGVDRANCAAKEKENMYVLYV